MLGTEGGELLIIEGSELKATMSTETGTGVCSLLSHSKVRDGLKVWGVLVLQDPPFCQNGTLGAVRQLCEPLVLGCTVAAVQ